MFPSRHDRMAPLRATSRIEGLRPASMRSLAADGLMQKGSKRVSFEEQRMVRARHATHFERASAMSGGEEMPCAQGAGALKEVDLRCRELRPCCWPRRGFDKASGGCWPRVGRLGAKARQVKGA